MLGKKGNNSGIEKEDNGGAHGCRRTRRVVLLYTSCVNPSLEDIRCEVYTSQNKAIMD